MNLFTYLMGKKGHNSATNGDLFSYLISKEKYKIVEGMSISLKGTVKASMEIQLKTSETTQNGTPTPENPINVNTINGNNTILIYKNIDNTDNYPINLGSIELCKIGDYEDSIYYQSSSNNLFDQDTFIPNMINDASKVYDSSTGILTMTNNSTDTYMPSIYNKANYKEGINIDVEPNTDYTFSFSVDQPLSTMKNCVMGLNNNNQYSYITNFSHVNVISFNTGNYTKIAIRLGSTASVGTVTHFSNFQLEKGSQTPYEPYEQGWFIKKNIGKVTLTGNDITGINTNQTNTTRAKTDQHFINALTEGQGYSNYFSLISNWDNDNVGIYFSSANGDIWFRAEKSLIGTTLDSVKSWVNSNNVIAYYILAIPTYIKISDTSLINQLNDLSNAESKQGETNITQTNNDLPFIIKAKIKIR